MKEFDALVKTIRKLRAPGGCPWDRAQTIENYKKFILEETYELIDEISKNKSESVREELGDIFLILIVIADMFNEKNKFTLKEVLKHVNEKLVLRHPHVFSNTKLKTDKEVLAFWIKHKAKHKKRKTIKERLPQMAPALLLSDIFFKEYAHIKNKKEYKKEEISERIKDKLNSFYKCRNKKAVLGELLFEVGRLSSLYNLDPENVLREKVIKEAENSKYSLSGDAAGNPAENRGAGRRPRKGLQ
ncbi:MAG: MazG nucleotide pyrophosphohydrolase domain-containing protein [Candidatus Omnitrophica bacterium]|nr:MazG nucleotide pyrophosphohydrolase domain-containing protein [Candidatus Omnitrophota bacterium]